MDDNDFLIWTFGDGDYCPGVLEVDNKLKETTHTCPRHGGYCTPDCALAFTVDNCKSQAWMCAEAANIGNLPFGVSYPVVRWK